MATVSHHLFFDETEVDGIDSLLAEFGAGAFASPYRSTIPLVALVKDELPLFKAIAVACGSAVDFSTHFEYKVAASKGVGNPSQTDAMVLSPGSALAIEAKWTEPRYETVAKRLKNRVDKLIRGDPNVDNVEKHDTAERKNIDSWLELLRRQSLKPIQPYAPKFRLCLQPQV